MQFILNDGGRSAAGFKGSAGDCCARSISIATGKPYKEIYDLVNSFSAKERTGTKRRGMSSARSGVHKHTARKIMESLGWIWHPTMTIGSGCKVHLRENELPKGRLMVLVSRHYTAVIDGVINDTFDPSRDGKRCVYGYYAEN